MDEKTLGTADFNTLTGLSETEVKAALKSFSLPPLRYRELSAQEVDDTENAVRRAIDQDEMRRSGDDDPSVWVRGWAEVAKQVKGKPITPEALRPQYFRGEPTCRFFGRYIRPLAPEFEYYAGLALRRLIFSEFLTDYETIAEFGCGTGINILLLSEQFPGKKLIGVDWAPASKDILDEMASQTNQPISGLVFNMLNATGWSGEGIDRKSACVTVHAMEQLGSAWRPFADYLYVRRPGLCLHIEPLFELYNEASAFDELARRYHLKRGYLRGFHPYVLDLCDQGKAELILSRRIQFGGLFHEAYSVLAWRPK